MTRRLTLPLVPLLALSSAAAAGGQVSSDVRELFVRNCAACHGERGDGQGVTDLDRKARSFKDGGFSYGNTPETVQRTIRSGIPGTPMPAFGEAFEASQVEALALYVIELGPGLPPPPENTELVVKGRPVIVRGLLPPIAEGTQNQTRGLLVGLPDGFTFEYRTDDVRLLGVRQGRFVDRTDWIGRGGTPLAPLGRVVALLEGGEPRSTFARVDGARLSPLAARLRGTSVLLADPRQGSLGASAALFVPFWGARPRHALWQSSLTMPPHATVFAKQRSTSSVSRNVSSAWRGALVGGRAVLEHPTLEPLAPGEELWIQPEAVHVLTTVEELHREDDDEAR